MHSLFCFIFFFNIFLCQNQNQEQDRTCEWCGSMHTIWYEILAQSVGKFCMDNFSYILGLEFVDVKLF